MICPVCGGVSCALPVADEAQRASGSGQNFKRPPQGSAEILGTATGRPAFRWSIRYKGQAKNLHIDQFRGCAGRVCTPRSGYPPLFFHAGHPERKSGVRRSREASTHDIHSLGDSGKNPNTHERRKDT